MYLILLLTMLFVVQKSALTDTSATPLSLDDLNHSTTEQIVAQLGQIFENSPWVAQKAVDKRPFGTVDELYSTMMQAVYDADKKQQLALIRAHPDLAGRVQQLSQSSTSEQANAGLSNLSDRQMAEFQSLNAAYKSRFGFPFVLALRDLPPNSGIAGILTEFRRRINNTEEAELREALAQIGRIAKHRLVDRFQRS